MATITITSNGIRCGAINAGDEINIVVESDVVLSSLAALRVVMLGPIRGGAGASIIAVSGPIGSERSGVLVTATTQARDLMRPLLPTDVVPARIECVDASSGRYVAGVTTQLRNSFLLWSSDALPAQSFASGNTLADIAATLAAHINARNNPHDVTAEQVGADPVGSAAAAVSLHADRKNNPHGVTEAQVAAASTEDADKAFGRLAEDNVWTGNNSVRGTFLVGPTGTNGVAIYKATTFLNRLDYSVGALDIMPKSDDRYVGAKLRNPYFALTRNGKDFFLASDTYVQADGVLYLRDQNNTSHYYGLSVRNGKLYFDDAPITASEIAALNDSEVQ